MPSSFENLITIEGLERLKSERESLMNSRELTVNDVQNARELGDLSENAEYHTAKDKLRIINKRLEYLNTIYSRHIIPNIDRSSPYIRFGAYVTWKDENNNDISYRIVGIYESEYESGSISVLTPLATASLGKKVNDVVNINLDNTLQKLIISNVEYK